MSIYYNLYCDESGVHDKRTFYLGALCCTPERAEILKTKINVFRDKHYCYGEMKWSKVSRQMLSVYIEFSNIFLDAPYTRVIVMQVQKGESWKEWAPTEEQRFFKTYYIFLRLNTLPYYRYGMFMDYKDGKSYRWSSLQFALNNAIKRDGFFIKQKWIHTLKPLNSKENSLIQLVDVIMGALISNASAPHKQNLSEHVKCYLNSKSHSGKEKIKKFVWSPKIDLRF